MFPEDDKAEDDKDVEALFKIADKRMFDQAQSKGGTLEQIALIRGRGRSQARHARSTPCTHALLDPALVP